MQVFNKNDKMFIWLARISFRYPCMVHRPVTLKQACKACRRLQQKVQACRFLDCCILLKFTWLDRCWSLVSRYVIFIQIFCKLYEKINDKVVYHLTPAEQRLPTYDTGISSIVYIVIITCPVCFCYSRTFTVPHDLLIIVVKNTRIVGLHTFLLNVFFFGGWQNTGNHGATDSRKIGILCTKSANNTDLRRTDNRFTENIFQVYFIKIMK